MHAQHLIGGRFRLRGQPAQPFAGPGGQQGDPVAGPAGLAGANDAANTGGTAPDVPAPAFAATRWADAAPMAGAPMAGAVAGAVAGAPPAQPAASAATAMATAAAAPRTARGRNLMPL